MEEFEVDGYRLGFSHEGNDYSVTIEVDENNDWRVMKVSLRDEPEIWEDMQIVPANVTKAMVAAIEEFLES